MTQATNRRINRESRDSDCSPSLPSPANSKGDEDMAESGGIAHGPDDEALVECLARALGAVDPPPPPLDAIARGLLAWRTVDAELAALLDEGCAHTPTATD
jgi:hypothetical protein